MISIPKRENALFARQLRKLMQDRGWNCNDVALLAGVSNKAVSHWCCGRCLPTEPTFKRLCKAAGMDTGYFKAHGYVYRNPQETHQPALPLMMPPKPAEQPQPVAQKVQPQDVLITLQNITLSEVPLHMVSEIAKYIQKGA